MAPPDPITCEELIVACQLALDSIQFKYNIIFKKATKKDIETQNTVKLGLEEGVLELPIPGEPGHRIIPLRGSIIKFPGTRIIPLKEFRI